jgi:hypothetical protein
VKSPHASASARRWWHAQAAQNWNLVSWAAFGGAGAAASIGTLLFFATPSGADAVKSHQLRVSFGFESFSLTGVF